MSRDDLAAAVKDKSTTEVEKRLGKPEAVEESAGTLKWTYTSKTFTTGDTTKMDSRTVVVFKKNDANAPATVVEVQYQ